MILMSFKEVFNIICWFIGLSVLCIAGGFLIMWLVYRYSSAFKR